MVEAKRTTLPEFEVLSNAYKIKRHDEMTRLAWQAWFNQRAKATKKSGKSYVSKWRDFNHFFNEEKEFLSLFDVQQTSKPLTMADRNRLLRKGGN